jgi:hypothetical protein
MDEAGASSSQIPYYIYPEINIHLKPNMPMRRKQ